MPILEKFIKQPADVQDYDIDFNEWLAAFPDTALSHVAVAEAGLTLQFSQLLNGVVKVWLSGGADGGKYKVTATLTTTGGRVKQAEIQVSVKEV